MNGANPTPVAVEKKNTWLWVAVIVVAFLALVVAWYYYSYEPQVPGQEGVAGEEARELDALAEDLTAVPTEGLDSELEDIDKELTQ